MLLAQVFASLALPNSRFWTSRDPLSRWNRVRFLANNQKGPGCRDVRYSSGGKKREENAEREISGII